jgi:hypothetical protein
MHNTNLNSKSHQIRSIGTLVQTMRWWKIVILILLFIICVTSTFEVFNFMNSIALQEWYIQIAIAVGLFLGYFVLVKFAVMAALNRSQTWAIVLVVIALSIFGYAFVGVKIPSTYTYESSNAAMVCNDGTPMYFSIFFNFSTVGSFSAENPVHVQVFINNVNISDLTAHIAAITLTDAYNAQQSSVIVGGTPAYGYITLYQSKIGEYVGEGNLVWHQSVSCYIIPLPPFSGIVTSPNLATQQLSGNPTLYISPVSDTLSFESNHIMEQLTYVMVGFSVIILQPILNALFPDKPVNESVKPQNPPNSPPSKPYRKKHQKEH